MPSVTHAYVYPRRVPHFLVAALSHQPISTNFSVTGHLRTERILVNESNGVKEQLQRNF